MPEPSNAYPVDPESVTEMARLLDQDRLLTRRVSGLLPPDVDPTSVQEVLDLGCGPGGWALDVASAYPHLHTSGIDISPRMIAYARAQATNTGRDNADFAVMDFQRLEFADAAFDVVNARLVQWFLPANRREQIVREWYRVLRPGGVLRLVEGEFPVTSSPTLERLLSKLVAALEQQGKTAIAGGRYLGLALYLSRWLRQLGCQHIQETAHVLNFSAGTPDCQAGIQDALRGVVTMGPLLVAMHLASEQEVQTWTQQIRAELASPEFVGMACYVSAWGRKPLSSGG